MMKEVSEQVDFMNEDSVKDAEIDLLKLKTITANQILPLRNMSSYLVILQSSHFFTLFD